MDKEKERGRFRGVDLQWFAQEEDDAVPGLRFAPIRDEEFEFVEGDPEPNQNIPEEYRDKEKEDLVQEIARIKQELNESRNAASSTVAMREELRNLTDQLAGRTRQEPAQNSGSSQQQQQQPQESEEEFAERVREMSLEDPYKAQLEMFNRKVNPYLRNLYDTNIKTNLYHSRSRLELDPQRRDVYKRYQGEIEAEVQRMLQDNPQAGLDPEIYQRAFGIVRGNHLDEIIEEKMNLLMQERVQEREKTESAPKPPPGEVSGTGPRPTPQGKKKKIYVKLTPEQEADYASRGVPKAAALRIEARKKGLIEY